MHELASFGHAVGLSVLHFLWQGTLIALVAALALRSLRDSTPQARYLVACTALLLCLLLPLITLFALLAGNAPALSAGAPTAAWLAPMGEPTRSEAAVGNTGTLQLLTWCASATWAFGTSLMLLRLAFGLAWVGRLRRSPQAVTDHAWQATVMRLASLLGLDRKVELLVVPRLSSPIAIGWWRPVVLLPAALLTKMPPDLIEALIAHELAHIRRHDYLANLAQHVIEALLFFHPVTWWLSARIRQERELIADRLAVAATGSPKRLALALSQLSELDDGTHEPHLAIAARGAKLLPRIEQLLRPQSPVAAGIPVVLLLVGLIGVVSASHAYVQTRERAVAPVAAATTHATRAPRLSFALVRGAGQPVLAWGPDDDIHLAAQALGSNADAFLLIRRNGVDHVVTDARFVDPLVESWSAVEREGLELDASYQRMENELEQMQALNERVVHSPRTTVELADQLQHANERLRSLELDLQRLEKNRDASAAELERSLHQLSNEALPAVPG